MSPRTIENVGWRCSNKESNIAVIWFSEHENKNHNVGLDGDFDMNQNPSNIVQHRPTCWMGVFK